ncbi:PAS domain-containing sensor histidine kinase [Paenarthrobacter sp. Z7-10]|nr:PAS domain-containing sensor histidine kinase [Paenarthrobacter sp. Z7-10]
MIAAGTAPLINKFFYQRSLRIRVLLTQLPLTVSVLLVLAVAIFFHPETMANPLFQLGLLMHALLLAACVLVPWERIPYPSFLVIPYLDFVAVGFSRQGSIETITGLGMLAVFPVFWLAASGLARRTAIVVSFVAMLMIVWVPVVAEAGPISGQALARPMLLPLITLAIAITVSVMTTSMAAQRHILLAKDAQFRAALAASRAREQLLDAIVETITVGLVAVDADGHDIMLNRKQKKFHQLAAPAGNPDPSEQELLIFAPDQKTALPLAERPVQRAVGGDSFTDMLIWIGQGAGSRALSATARPIGDDAGRPAGSVVAFYDVTELVNALAAKDDFVSNISHEFRTPLTSILGYIGLALEDAQTLPPAVVQYLKVAERNADRLLDLVSDLLSVATHALDIKPRHADMAELIELCLDSAAPRATDNRVTLINECHGPLMAIFDVGRIGQVLDNLISNAIKYSPDGGSVAVRAWVQEGQLLCEVQDNGIGMDEAETAEAFTKFFRAGAVRRSAIPGVGLGLLITKTILESHGGTIELHSELGVGTRVRFTLPMGGTELPAQTVDGGEVGNLTLSGAGALISSPNAL